MNLLRQTKQAARALLRLSDAQRADILRRLADAIEAASGELLEANAADLQRMTRRIRFMTGCC